MLTAITREINTELNTGELTYLTRVGIDIDLAQTQHREYRSVLAALGCELVSVPTAQGLADSVFIEDTAIVLDEIAVLCRPGAVSRRAEVAGVEAVLQEYRSLKSIQPPGTLDGGDLLQIGKTVFAGLSTRSNQSGIQQLSDFVTEYGYRVETVAPRQCLHLKSAVSELAPGMLLINPDWVEKSAFDGLELIEIDPREAHAANALRVGQDIIYPACFPHTQERLLRLGVDVHPVNVSELQKAEGAVTCCSLILTSVLTAG